MPLAGLAGVKTSDAARRRPYILTAHRSSFCHAELVSASVSGDVLEMARSGILKRVQDDICVLTAHRSQLIAHNSLLKTFFCQKSKSAVICRICVISVPSKFFTKPYFRINPAGKSKVPSWKIFISQLEKYFFPVGKSKFRSRAK